MRYFTFKELMSMAAEAKQPVEVIVKVGMQLEEKELREQEERRATDEEKEKLLKLVKEMDAEGKLNANTRVEDILNDAGVRHVQGTASVVAFARRKLLTKAA